MNNEEGMYDGGGRHALYHARPVPRIRRARRGNAEVRPFRFFSHGDLFNGKWETDLDKPLAQPKMKEKPEVNGAEVAAEILLKVLDKPPKKPRGRPKVRI